MKDTFKFLFLTFFSIFLLSCLLFGIPEYSVYLDNINLQKAEIHLQTIKAMKEELTINVTIGKNNNAI